MAMIHLPTKFCACCSNLTSLSMDVVPCYTFAHNPELFYTQFAIL